MENNFPRSGRGRGHSQRKSQEDGMAGRGHRGHPAQGTRWGGGGPRASVFEGSGVESRGRRACEPPSMTSGPLAWSWEAKPGLTGRGPVRGCPVRGLESRELDVPPARLARAPPDRDGRHQQFRPGLRCRKLRLGRILDHTGTWERRQNSFLVSRLGTRTQEAPLCVSGRKPD